MVWRPAEGKPPEWDRPELSEVGQPDWTDSRRLRWKIRTHNQEMAENVVLRVLSTSKLAMPRGPIAAFRRWRQQFDICPAGSPAAAPG
jgi:hypothetical protein